MTHVDRRAEMTARTILEDTPILTIQGARQVGKSTLAQRLADDCGGVVVTLDDDLMRGAAQSDPVGFVDQHPSGLLVIDEIQRVPDLVLALKVTVDRDRRPGRFAVTGSADLLRVPGAGDSLAGRAETVHLRGLSVGERLGTPDDLASRLATGDLWRNFSNFTTSCTRGDLVDHILAGGFPALRDRSVRRRAGWLDDYTARLLRRDATDLVSTDPARLVRLLDALAADQAGELVKARYSRTVGTSEATVSRHLELLETLFLIDMIPAWSRNLTSRVASRPKSIVSDSALAAHRSRSSHDLLASPTGFDRLGGLLEGFVTGELLKQRSWSIEPFELHHFRDRDGLEVDLVLEFEDGSVAAIEVKAATGLGAKHFAGLRSFADKLGRDFRGGVVLHTGTKAARFTDDLIGLPVSALWEL